MAGSRTPLAKLIDENCVTSGDFGRWLGFTKRYWWQIRKGQRRLQPEKCRELAKILKLGVREVEKVARESFKGDK